MKRLILALALSVPMAAFAGGAGGSWGDGDFGGGGGSTGGGGAGGSWDETCPSSGWTRSAVINGLYFATPDAACRAIASAANQVFLRVEVTGTSALCRMRTASGGNDQWSIRRDGEVCSPPPVDPPPVDPPPVDPNPDCNVCSQLTDIRNKLNNLKTNDENINITINNLTNLVNNIQTNIDASFNDLSSHVQNTNTFIQSIDNSVIELTSIVNNYNNKHDENINKVYEKLFELETNLKLDADLYANLNTLIPVVKNTNKLVLDLDLDIKKINDKLDKLQTPQDVKDYTEILERINQSVIDSAYDDAELMKLLNELKDFLEAPFDSEVDGKIDVQELGADVNLRDDRINFQKICPPPSPIAIKVAGFMQSDEMSYQPLCDFFERLSPFIKGFGALSAAIILGGGLRRG